MRLLAILLLLTSCMLPPPYVPAPIPPAPTPDPVEPAEPTGVTRATFAEILVGAAVTALEGLPPPSRTVAVGARTIHAWTLDEDRQVGGKVSWEVHTEEGVIVASFAW